MTLSKNICLGLALIAAANVAAPNSANADFSTLDDLLNGGSLNDSGTTYSNFQLLFDIGTVSVDPTQISVETITGQSGLEFQSESQFLLNDSLESIILQIGFDAATTGSNWSESGVDLTAGNPTVSGNGVIDVFNSVSDSSANVLATTNAVFDPAFGIEIGADSQSLGGFQTDVSFASSLSLFGDSNSIVSLNSYRVTLSVPEPATASLFAIIGMCGLLRRRNQ